MCVLFVLFVTFGDVFGENLYLHQFESKIRGPVLERRNFNRQSFSNFDLLGPPHDDIGHNEDWIPSLTRLHRSNGDYEYHQRGDSYSYLPVLGIYDSDYNFNKEDSVIPHRGKSNPYNSRFGIQRELGLKRRTPEHNYQNDRSTGFNQRLFGQELTSNRRSLLSNTQNERRYDRTHHQLPENQHEMNVGKRYSEHNTQNERYIQPHQISRDIANVNRQTDNGYNNRNTNENKNRANKPYKQEEQSSVNRQREVAENVPNKQDSSVHRQKDNESVQSNKRKLFISRKIPASSRDFNSDKPLEKNDTTDEVNWIWGTDPETETTTDSLDDRVALAGGKCPSGMIRVAGKCIQTY